MSIDSSSSSIAAEVLARAIDAEAVVLSADAARSILQLDFQAADHQRMELLAEKASQGNLTPDELREAEGYNQAGQILALLQSKARQSLRKTGLQP